MNRKIQKKIIHVKRMAYNKQTHKQQHTKYQIEIVLWTPMC